MKALDVQGVQAYIGPATRSGPDPVEKVLIMRRSSACKQHANFISTRIV